MKLIVQVPNELGVRVDIKEFREGEHYEVLGRRKIKLLRHVWFLWNGNWTFINSGFIYNGASIPGAFWFFIGEPTEQKFALASLIHDYLYMMRADRGLADSAFRELLDDARVNGRRVALMFWAVRVGGWWYYR